MVVFKKETCKLEARFMPVILGLLFIFNVSAHSQPSAISSIYNPEVAHWIHMFSRSHPSYVKKWLKRSYRYLPLMKSILKDQGLPEDLVYMTLVESSLSPHATSTAQAVGYWQFIPATAKRFGLNINKFVDERRDFEKSTRAAAKYLKELHSQFSSWPLAIAAYNMGENKLRKKIAQHKTRDFWELSKKSGFPKETKEYLPKIIAALRIIKSPDLYGFNHFKILLPLKFDKFYLPGGYSLKKVAQSLNISLKELRRLNPELKLNKLPAFTKNYPLRIPRGSSLLLSKSLGKDSKISYGL